MPDGTDNPERVAERNESPLAPFDQAWQDIQDASSPTKERGRRYAMLYVAEHAGRTYHDYSEFLKKRDRARLVDEIAGSLGPRGADYKDAIGAALEDLAGGNAGVLPDPSRANTASAGDPVVMFNGGFVQQADDLRVNGAGIDFVFRRTYRNQAVFFGPLGANWNHAYNLRLKASDTELRLTTGDLREQIYTRHPRFGERGFDYFVPPDGQHAIVALLGSSFVHRGPDGLRHVFEPDPGWSDGHRLAGIDDRFGNFLQFTYGAEDGLLDRVAVNHASRSVRFAYDETGRIVAIADFTGRTWRYGYDDLGDLATVTTPATDRYQAGLTTSYEYTTAQTSGLGRHNLTRIVDPAGRLYLENEYGTASSDISFNRVVRQRQGGGESFFAYENIDAILEANYTDQQRPAHQTNFTDRNGHAVHFIYNRSGNLLLQEEYVFDGGLPRLLIWRHRYNRDGELTATLSPEGVITQHLYGRADFVARHGIEDEDAIGTHDALSADERLAFGRLLATVRRGRYYGVGELRLASLAWGDIFPDVLGGLDAHDIVMKFTYEPRYGQISTTSDPRTTERADPWHAEPPAYEAGLTRCEYDGPSNDPLLFLRRIRHPTPTQADGTAGDPIVEEFTSYDERGRLVEKVDAAGVVSKYSYFTGADGLREGHLRETIVDPAGLAVTTRHEVDALGRVITVEHPRALEGTPGHFFTRYDHNELDQIVGVISSLPFGVQTRRFYDPNGNVEREERDAKDEHGVDLPDAPAVHTFQYDEELNLVCETTGGARLATHLVTRHRYDAAGVRVLTISPGGSRTRISYDERKQQIAVTLGAGTVDASTTRTEYDGDGRVRRTKGGRGHTTTLSLDPFGRIVARLDALGHETRRSFDKGGNPTVERIFERGAAGSFALLARSERAHDELGRMIRTGQSRFDDPLPVASPHTLEDAFEDPPPGTDLLVTGTFYDAKGRVTRTIDPIGHEHAFEYDALDRVTGEIDALGNRIESRYDAHGNVVRKDARDVMRDPTTGATVGERVFPSSWAYDELDRMVTETDSLGNTTRYAYDTRNGVVRRVDALGNVTRTEYDSYGRRVAQIVEQTETGLGGGAALLPAVTQSEYDPDGNLTALVDALGRTTRQTFDALDRRREVEYPDGSRSRVSYDGDDNIVVAEDGNGLRRVLTVDALGRTIRVEVDRRSLVSGVAVEGADTTAYDYDALGRPRREQNDFARCDVRFDSLGRPLEETISMTASAAPFGPLVLRRKFNEVGALVGLTYPGGRTIQFERDGLDRLIGVYNVVLGEGYPGGAGTADGHEIAVFEYAGRHRARNLLGNGASATYLHDGAGRMIQIAHASVSTPLLTMQYLHDAVGNPRICNEITPAGVAGKRLRYDSFARLARVEPRDNPSVIDPAPLAPSPVVPADPIPHGQDAIDALIGGLELAQPTNWEYDLTGNRRTERQAGGGAVAFAVNQLDQYVEVDGTVLVYDHSGNMIGDGRREYRYDSMNRLVRVLDVATGVDVARFFHDSRGRRIVERQGGATIHLVYDGWNLIAEYRTGVAFAQYVHDDVIDRVLQIAADGAEHWYHTDLTGSVRVLSDATGAAHTLYRYAPFGELEEAPIGSAYNRLMYNGRCFDAALHTYDFRSRVYDPRLGRFLQRDPAGMIDGTNLYRYGGDNPLGYVDPSGMDRERVTTSVSYSHRDISSTNNYTLKGLFKSPDDLTFGLVSDKPFKALGLRWRGIAAHASYFPVPGTKWGRAGGLRLGAATTLELDVDWRPAPLVFDVSLSGSAVVSTYAPGQWREKMAIAGGRLRVSVMAKLHVDFGRFGNYKIATPVDVELNSRLTANGPRFDAKYGYGSWLAGAEGGYEGRPGYSSNEGSYARITKETEKNYGIGFYERVPRLAESSDPGPLVAPEDRPRNNVDIAWESYLGAGYRYSRTNIGRSRLEFSVSLGIGVNDQYVPDSAVLSGLLKYAWWR